MPQLPPLGSPHRFYEKWVKVYSKSTYRDTCSGRVLHWHESSLSRSTRTYHICSHRMNSAHSQELNIPSTDTLKQWIRWIYDDLFNWQRKPRSMLMTKQSLYFYSAKERLIADLEFWVRVSLLAFIDSFSEQLGLSNRKKMAKKAQCIYISHTLQVINSMLLWIVTLIFLVWTAEHGTMTLMQDRTGVNTKTGASLVFAGMF